MLADLNPDTLGALPLFQGKAGAIDLDGVTASLTIKGKVNDLDQYAPRNLYRISCNHAFCDTGCTLSRASVTAHFTVGAGPSAAFIPWASAPTNAAAFQNGRLVITSGASAGSRRSIAQATSAGLALSYPLATLPAPGDTFNAQQGCDKTLNSGSCRAAPPMPIRRISGASPSCRSQRQRTDMAILRAGKTLLVDAPAGQESHAFATEAEAIGRQAFVEEALSWIGTPFCDCSDVKGPKGAVDCAMLMTRCAVDTGMVAPFDPRPYAPRWHVHRDEELFVDWITGKLGAREVETARFGDIAVWQFGRTFSHGGIVINTAEVVHAYYANRMVIRTRRDEPLLSQIAVFASVKPRPVRYFDCGAPGHERGGMSGLMGGGGSSPTNAPIVYSGLSVSTSQWNLPVALVWGTRRVTTNAIGYEKFPEAFAERQRRQGRRREGRRQLHLFGGLPARHVRGARRFDPEYLVERLDDDDDQPLGVEHDVLQWNRAAEPLVLLVDELPGGRAGLCQHRLSRRAEPQLGGKRHDPRQRVRDRPHQWLCLYALEHGRRLDQPEQPRTEQCRRRPDGRRDHRFPDQSAIWHGAGALATSAR